MGLNDIYTSNSNFLKAEDLKSKKPILTIASAEVVEKDYGEGPKKQIILSFEKTEKVLGLNFTNAAKIAELLGTEEFDEWVGRSIKLYQDTTKYQGKTVPCIRVFPELPPQAKGVAVGQAPDERPFEPTDAEKPDDTGDDIPF